MPDIEKKEIDPFYIDNFDSILQTAINNKVLLQILNELRLRGSFEQNYAARAQNCFQRSKEV